MKNVMVVIIAAVMLISVFAGIAAANERTGDQWGFKKEINLGSQFSPYLTVASDYMVSQINRGWENRTSYHIDQHSASMDGTFMIAGAMKKNGNNVDFKMGNYIKTHMNFSASGTFPYTSNVSNLIHFNPYNTTNHAITPKRMSAELRITYVHKVIVDGNAVTDGNGNINSVNSNYHYVMAMHVVGKNLPLPAMLYEALVEKATQYHYEYVDFQFSNATNNTLCFTANVHSMNGNSMIKVNGFGITYPGATVTVNDFNGNGYLDTGETLCIHGDIVGMAQAINNGERVMLTYKDPSHNIEEYASLNLGFGTNDFYIGGMDISYETIDPALANLVNKSKNLPAYDNFDFTVTVNYNQSTTTTYAPALPLLPKQDMKINETVTGTYSGTIDISGLQSEYKVIVEKLLNHTLPANIQDVNIFDTVMGHGQHFSHGKINMHTTMHVYRSMVRRTITYNDEKVYVVSLNPSGGYAAGFTRASLPQEDIEYYYSPSKGFVVGGSVNMGLKEFATEPDNYSDANKEIAKINNENVNASSEENNENGKGIPTNMLIIIGIVVAVVVVVLAVVLIRKKRGGDEGTEAVREESEVQDQQGAPQEYQHQQDYAQNYQESDEHGYPEQYSGQEYQQ